MKLWKYIFGTLLLVLSVVVIAIFQLPDSNLHIITCNVGQGDAILVTFGSTQILTDGGPDNSVLTCLGKYMPFWDRNIELVISTHPDADHSTGLVDVIKNYNVGQILVSPIDPGTQVYEVLRKGVGSHDIPTINPTEGMAIRVGPIQLDVVSRFDPANNDTNFNSIVYKLEFGSFSGLFPGDIPPIVADRLAGEMGEVNYIKIPHHGSTNGLTENLLKTTMPKIAVISVGKNSWGFPRPEILDMLAKYRVKVYRTDQMGDVEVVTDGKEYWIKN